jgi:hypothetical protein
MSDWKGKAAYLVRVRARARGSLAYLVRVRVRAGVS